MRSLIVSVRMRIANIFLLINEVAEQQPLRTSNVEVANPSYIMLRNPLFHQWFGIFKRCVLECVELAAQNAISVFFPSPSFKMLVMLRRPEHSQLALTLWGTSALSTPLTHRIKTTRNAPVAKLKARPATIFSIFEGQNPNRIVFELEGKKNNLLNLQYSH